MLSILGEEVGGEDGDGADEDVTKPGGGVDFNDDEGFVGGEEVVVDDWE